MFAPLDCGSYIATLSDKAREFGGGDDDRIAAAAFARFLTQFEIPFQWHDDLRFTAEDRQKQPWTDVQAQASKTTEADYVEVIPSAAFTVAVRVASASVVIHSLASLYVWESAIELHGPKVPYSAVLSINRWLRCFPHLTETNGVAV